MKNSFINQTCIMASNEMMNIGIYLLIKVLTSSACEVEVIFG